ncbi:FixH family protein [Cypionkella sp.]|jgi:nitrogen fixation protein FixH|uniref:FixH family protein n=1 Tax=Cypionkella sp. TaxID=2811411 RepID=UPI00271E5334|nr:FixH family protein [Cypionkella sp.]MDO8983356.1 FixH family protein [Cypionkella sp.]MDP2050200.1 FixH family protein [Cypionkella sp.]
MAKAGGREIKGWHVLAFTVAAFGVIIAVNLLMAYKAISTFPGLEVENSYVASQTFDADRRAQEALGWTVAPGYDGAKGELILAFTDAAGKPVVVEGLDVLLGRVTEAREDSTPRFVYEGGVYVAKAALHPGKWMLHVTAHSGDGVLFQQRLNLFVKG